MCAGLKNREDKCFIRDRIEHATLFAMVLYYTFILMKDVQPLIIFIVLI